MVRSGRSGRSFSRRASTTRNFFDRSTPRRKSKTMNKIGKGLAGLFLFVFGLVMSVFATAPAEIDTAIADATSTWTSIKTLIVAVGVFVVLWKFFKKGISKA